MLQTFAAIINPIHFCQPNFQNFKDVLPTPVSPEHYSMPLLSPRAIHVNKDNNTVIRSQLCNTYCTGRKALPYYVRNNTKEKVPTVENITYDARSVKQYLLSTMSLYECSACVLSSRPYSKQHITCKAVSFPFLDYITVFSSQHAPSFVVILEYHYLKHLTLHYQRMVNCQHTMQ
jgi:hypothetical protein